jgi:transcriptional regulator with XRE-family HTH domain
VLPDLATRPTLCHVADGSVADLIRRLRSERSESLRKAARDLGVDASYLSRVEAGTRTPSSELEGRIQAHYGVPKDLVDLAVGRVPEDVLVILREHPELLDEIRRRYAR